MAGITLLSKHNHPHKVFGTIEDGAAFGLPNLRGKEATAEALTQVANILIVRGL